MLQGINYTAGTYFSLPHQNGSAVFLFNEYQDHFHWGQKWSEHEPHHLPLPSIEVQNVLSQSVHASVMWSLDTVWTFSLHENKTSSTWNAGDGL
jgi:hypothetical protein